MKLKLFLLFIIALNFSSVNNSNHLSKRKLDTTDNNKLLLIGFEKYTNDTGNQEIDEVHFNMHLKILDNDTYLNSFDSIYLKSSVTFLDGKTNDNMEIYCNKPNFEKQHIYSKCEIKNLNKANPITNVTINDYTFMVRFNNTYNFTLSEDQILLSSLAEETIKNIENQNETLFYWAFFLTKEPNVTKDEVLLYGDINYDDDDYDGPRNFTFNLNLPENTYCSYNYYNYTNGNSQIITFTPKNNINAHLNGMMSKTSFNDYYILLFTNTSNDLVLYSTVKSSSVDLYGFENYNKSGNGNAENVAVFFGTSNILKKYLRFTAKIRYGSNSNSTLRFLDEKTTNVTVTGTIISESTDIDNGVFKYKNVFPGTENISNILGIDSWHNYEFSDDGQNYIRAIINIVGDNINLRNEGKLENPIFINFTEGNPTMDGNTFSFKFKLKSSNSNMNITKQQPVFLNYSSMETLERDEIDSCTIENNTNTFTINCEPKKDIYTLLNSLIIKVPNITTNRRLRFLQSSGNSTIRVPKTTTGDIQFEYNPEINTFGRRSSKKKGLSGGAIAAIVLATIAAVAAVAVAIFFLNRGPINPIKTSTEMNLPNSTTNINN